MPEKKKFQPILDAVAENLTINEFSALKEKHGWTWVRISKTKVGDTYSPLAPTLVDVCKDVGIDPRNAINHPETETT